MSCLRLRSFREVKIHAESPGVIGVNESVKSNNFSCCHLFGVNLETLKTTESRPLFFRIAICANAHREADAQMRIDYAQMRFG